LVQTEVLVVSQEIRKEGCPSNEMKTGTYQPNQGVCAYFTAKAAIFSIRTKANISTFAMKTCTELSPELVRHSIGSE
jgi:hypothetical protein